MLYYVVIIGLVSAFVIMELRMFYLYIAPRNLDKKEIILWEKDGEYVKVYGYDVFVLVIGDFEKADSTLVLLHGFAESSHVFRFLLDDLAEKFQCVIAIDFLGFGLSDKPGDFKYSLSNHVGTVLNVLKEKDVEGCHFYAHGMGDAVLCELISRQVRNELPKEFKGGIQSATFTNGNMLMEYLRPSRL